MSARYITNKHGRRIAVRIPIGQFRKFQRELTMLRLENKVIKGALDAAVPKAEDLAKRQPYYQNN